MTKEQIKLFGETGTPRPAEPAEKTNRPFLPGLPAGYAAIEDWDLLQDLAGKCELCPLRQGCRQVVVGDGPHPADVMLVGEGPGQSEDEIGKPFVGRAGQLLDKILEAAGITRSMVYITNVVKCRPPQNRLPNPQEIAACQGYLESQIKMVAPSILICLGALATQTLVDPKAKITVVRGKWFVRDGVMIMPTFHPAALLRNESLKRPVWEDFKLIRQEIQKKGLKA
jgi:DNA polymerase